MAEKYLKEKMIPAVIDDLIVGHYSDVQLRILGAVDAMFSKGLIDGPEASEVYQKLGIPPKDIFRIRTNAAKQQAEVEEEDV